MAPSICELQDGPLILAVCGSLVSVSPSLNITLIKCNNVVSSPLLFNNDSHVSSFIYSPSICSPFCFSSKSLKHLLEVSRPLLSVFTRMERLSVVINDSSLPLKSCRRLFLAAVPILLTVIFALGNYDLAVRSHVTELACGQRL